VLTLGGGDQGVEQAAAEVGIVVLMSLGELLDDQGRLAERDGSCCDHAVGQVGLADTAEPFEGDQVATAGVIDASHGVLSIRVAGGKCDVVSKSGGLTE
jgi:hypothetical protein